MGFCPTRKLRNSPPAFGVSPHLCAAFAPVYPSQRREPTETVGGALKMENKMASAANDYPGACVKGADFGAGASKRRKEGERRVMLKFHRDRFSTIPLKQSKAGPGKKEQMKAQSSKMIGGILAVGVGIGGILALNLTLPPSVGTGHAQGLGQQPSAKVTAK